MRKSLSLSAYLALRKPSSSQQEAPRPARPAGPLLWLHCASAERLWAAAMVAEQLVAEGDQLTVLITSDNATNPIENAIVQPSPDETSARVKAFVDHWQPDILLWLDGELRPALLLEIARKSIPSIVVDVSEQHPDLPTRYRVPGLSRSTLGLFDTAFYLNPLGKKRLERAGLTTIHIHKAAQFDPGPIVLPCDDGERDHLAGLLNSRPVWFAACPPHSEISALAEAYRIASQRAHRLVLIIATENPSAAKTQLTDAGLFVSDRQLNEYPQDATQIYLTDTSEMGLWYRLAPLTYIGGTIRGSISPDPFEAAALGSVVIHGMKIQSHQHRFDQLADAAAGRMVRSETDLGQTVEVLLAADKAAAMAHAAWDVTSRGAVTSMAILAMIREALGLDEG